jgi:putative glutamine transport system substrate-binding protein
MEEILMTKLKKLTAMGLSIVMALGLLAGCGSEAASSATSAAADSAPASTQDTGTVDGTVEAAASAETPAEDTTGEIDLASYGDDVQAIIDAGVLKVGVKNAVIGFGYQDTLTGEYSGMEIDLANKLGEILGVEVEFTTVTAATRTELLDSGDINCVLATFTITDERKESWDFTTPYYTDHVTVLVKDSSGITDLAGLEGKVVGVSSGSTSARSLVSAMVDEGVLSGDNFDTETFDASTWTEGVSFKQYDDYPSISTALEAGEVDAFCVDKSILAVYKTDGRSYIDAEFSPQEYGIATTKGSGLSQLCDDLVNQWLSDGTIDSLIAEYNLG